MAVVKAKSSTSAATPPHHADAAGSSIPATVSSTTGTIKASSGAVACGKPRLVMARSAPRRSINFATAATAKTVTSNNLTASKIIFIIAPIDTEVRAEIAELEVEQSNRLLYLEPLQV